MENMSIPLSLLAVFSTFMIYRTTVKGGPSVRRKVWIACLAASITLLWVLNFYYGLIKWI